MIDHLDTPAGHMLICLVVLLLGGAFHLFGIPKADDLIVGGSAALFACMRAKNSNA